MISNLSSSHFLLHGNTGVMNYVNISTFILVPVGINWKKSLLFMNKSQGPTGPREPCENASATTSPNTYEGRKTPGENDAHSRHLHLSNCTMPKTNVLILVHNENIHLRKMKLMSYYRKFHNPCPSDVLWLTSQLDPQIADQLGNLFPDRFGTSFLPVNYRFGNATGRDVGREGAEKEGTFFDCLFKKTCSLPMHFITLSNLPTAA